MNIENLEKVQDLSAQLCKLRHKKEEFEKADSIPLNLFAATMIIVNTYPGCGKTCLDIDQDLARQVITESIERLDKQIGEIVKEIETL